jgi:hypothetical protein
VEYNDRFKMDFVFGIDGPVCILHLVYCKYTWYQYILKINHKYLYFISIISILLTIVKSRADKSNQWSFRHPPKRMRQVVTAAVNGSVFTGSVTCDLILEFTFCCCTSSYSTSLPSTFTGTTSNCPIAGLNQRKIT